MICTKRGAFAVLHASRGAPPARPRRRPFEGRAGRPTQRGVREDLQPDRAARPSRSPPSHRRPGGSSGPGSRVDPLHPHDEAAGEAPAPRRLEAVHAPAAVRPSRRSAPDRSGPASCARPPADRVRAGAEASARRPDDLFTGRRTSSVATTRTSTDAGRSSLKRIRARSRKPSPFGLTVASSGVSPANGVPPFEIRSPSRRGGRARRGAGAASAESARTGRDRRERIEAGAWPRFPFLTTRLCRTHPGADTVVLWARSPLLVAPRSCSRFPTARRRRRGTGTAPSRSSARGHDHAQAQRHGRSAASRTAACRSATSTTMTDGPTPISGCRRRAPRRHDARRARAASIRCSVDRRPLQRVMRGRRRASILSAVGRGTVDLDGAGTDGDGVCRSTAAVPSLPVDSDSPSRSATPSGH